MDLYFDKYSYAEVGSVGIILASMRNFLSRTERNIAMHMHLNYEVHLLFEGEAHIATENGGYKLESGEIALIPPRVYHSITNTTATFQLMSFSFQLYIASEPCTDEEKWFQEMLNALSQSSVILLKEQPLIIQTIQLMAHEQETAGLAKSYLANAYATEMLIYLFRALPSASELIAKSQRSVDKSKRVTKAIQLERKRVIELYLEHHYLNATIEELSQLLSLSEQHTRRFLRNNYGMSFSQILNNHRVNVSKHLLQNTDKSITEIWDLVGFNSAQNFSIAFKRFTGTTASEYRAKHPPAKKN